MARYIVLLDSHESWVREGNNDLKVRLAYDVLTTGRNHPLPMGTPVVIGSGLYEHRIGYITEADDEYDGPLRLAAALIPNYEEDE